jgi:hypothetical protein
MDSDFKPGISLFMKSPLQPVMLYRKYNIACETRQLPRIPQALYPFRTDGTHKETRDVIGEIMMKLHPDGVILVTDRCPKQIPLQFL